MSANTLEKPQQATARELDIRIAAWAAAAALAVLLLGPMFLRVFKPVTEDSYGDFVQEWLSARNYWAGDPVYLPQREAMRRRTGTDVPKLEEILAWNGHPPAAVLIALPFGLMTSYQTAHMVWSLATFALFLAGIAIIINELRIRLHWWSVFPVIVLLLANNPVVAHIWWGQINFPVVFLLAVAWAANRRGYRAGAGVAAGLAAAIKLFPALLLIYFLATRNWRSAAFTLLAFAIANATALGVFGVQAFETYVRQVIPSLELFRESWANASVSAYWLRIFGALGEAQIGVVLGKASQLAVVLAVGFVAMRARTQDDRDRAFALALVGMPLASPIAWAHHFVILALPLLLLWERLPTGWLRVVFFAAVLMLLPPEGWYPTAYKSVAPGPPDTTPLLVQLPPPRDLGLCIVAFGCAVSALLTIFLLLARAPLIPSAAGPESEGPPDTIE